MTGRGAWPLATLTLSRLAEFFVEAAVHEIGIAQEVLRIIEEQARGRGGGKVRSVRLSVGALCGVVPESLEFALEVCAKGTRAEGMKIVLRGVPARGLCRGCGHEWDFEPGQMECPACRARDIRLSGGDDLRVDSFEMEESSEPQISNRG